MTDKQFVSLSRQKAANISKYIDFEAPEMVAQKTLRFIDGNFRAQGWQGSAFKPWAPIRRKGQILVKTGRLRRGTQHITSPGQVRFFNNVPYADIHNRGGIISASVNVRGFSRIRLKGKVIQEVKAHTRIMKTNMPQRQFMPYDDYGSPVLDASIMRDLDKAIRKILTF